MENSEPDSDETHIMHRKSNDIEIVIGSDTNEVLMVLMRCIMTLIR